MAEQLSTLFVEFLKDTIIGHESGFYKMTSGNTAPLKRIIPGMTMQFFNTFYDGLANKTYVYGGERMLAMQACRNHSPVCLINLLMFQCVNTHLSLDRSKFDESSYALFMASVEKEFNAKAPSVEELTPLFDHECGGDMEATPLPPGTQMFHMGTAPAGDNK